MFFSLVWGTCAELCIEQMEMYLCFKYEWDAFLLMDVENKMYMIQQCKVFYVAKKHYVPLCVRYIIWHSNQVLGQ